MAVVESSQPLSVESFSYCWLINLRPSIESLSESFRAAMDSSDESFFIEMDPNMAASKRFIKKLDSSPAFSDQPTDDDGLLANSPSTKHDYSDSSTPMSEFQNKYAASGDRKIRCSSLRRCRSLSSRKYFNCLRPLLSMIRFCRSKSKGRAADNGICWVVKTKSSYSTPTSTASFPGDRRSSCDSESSINEAVLHCKKSIGM